MNIWYILIGIVCVGLGIYLTIKQVKISLNENKILLGGTLKDLGLALYSLYVE